VKSEVFSLPPDCPPGDRRREHEDRCEVLGHLRASGREKSEKADVHCCPHQSGCNRPCQSVIQARGKGKEVFSLSDEGPDADAEQGQSEGAEREAEEQAVHCGVTSVRAVATAPVRLLFRSTGKGRWGGEYSPPRWGLTGQTMEFNNFIENYSDFFEIVCLNFGGIVVDNFHVVFTFKLIFNGHQIGFSINFQLNEGNEGIVILLWAIEKIENIFTIWINFQKKIGEGFPILKMDFAMAIGEGWPIHFKIDHAIGGIIKVKVFHFWLFHFWGFWLLWFGPYCPPHIDLLFRSLENGRPILK